MVIKKSLERKKQEVLKKEKKKWVNSKILKTILDDKLKTKVLEEEKVKMEKEKRKRLLTLHGTDEK